MLNKSYPLSYIKNISKNPKSYFCCTLTPLLWFRSWAMREKMQRCNNFSLLLSYHCNIGKEDKILHQNNESYTFELPLLKYWVEWISTKQKPFFPTSTRYILKKVPKSFFCISGLPSTILLLKSCYRDPGDTST